VEGEQRFRVGEAHGSAHRMRKRLSMRTKSYR
jgi:hypothetical protein